MPNVTNSKLCDMLLGMQTVQNTLLSNQTHIMNSLDRLEKKMEKLEQKTSLSPSSSSVHQEAIDALRTNLKDELVLQLEPMNQNKATLHTGLQDAKKIFSPPNRGLKLRIVYLLQNSLHWRRQLCAKRLTV